VAIAGIQYSKYSSFGFPVIVLFLFINATACGKNWRYIMKQLIVILLAGILIFITLIGCTSFQPQNGDNDNAVFLMLPDGDLKFVLPGKEVEIFATQGEYKFKVQKKGGIELARVKFKLDKKILQNVSASGMEVVGQEKCIDYSIDNALIVSIRSYNEKIYIKVY
jgi:hypothetical protein